MSAVLLERSEGVAELVLNRPEKRNALGFAEMDELQARLAEVAAGDCGALLLRGAGPAFCAGRDLAGFDFDSEDSEAVLAERVNPLVAALRGLDIPTLAAVQGPCLGLGFGLAMAVDIVYAADDARLGSPFRSIGFVLDSGGHQALAERIGRHRAAELIFTGRLVSGREAAAMGLVNGSLGGTRLLPALRAMARQIAAGPRLAFAESKRILRAGGDFETMAAAEAAAQGRAMLTADAREGIAAFLEKRKPRFTGR